MIVAVVAIITMMSSQSLPSVEDSTLAGQAIRSVKVAAKDIRPITVPKVSTTPTKSTAMRQVKSTLVSKPTVNVVKQTEVPIQAIPDWLKLSGTVPLKSKSDCSNLIEMRQICNTIMQQKK